MGLLGLLWGAGADASELAGPGRFCGYSPIIDLLPGEHVVTLDGGVHGGRFQWEGDFGKLEVFGIGWASRPKGRSVPKASSHGHVVFAERRIQGRYVIALWNRAHGAAYFSSPGPLTAAQRSAIGRVDLFEEGEEPAACDLRTTFAWE
ncbi:hypothetical protein CV103_14860 [Sphingomonas fennica]|uniref:Uncharacterized protein n=1 Tax=Edaphosphingomonas fennica TaxID=114404 RepID=A0A2T4HS04_9SPHN|nr:hypothetical protein CV103_14860 [Sphingomonas fennica]